MRIAVDLDGVLVNAVAEVKNRLEKDFNCTIIEHDFGVDGDTLAESYGIPSSYVWKTYYDDERFWATLPDFPENVATVQDWIRQGHEVHIVTGRRKEIAGLVTKGWLRRYDINYHALSFNKIMHKNEYLVANDIPVIFEDRFFEANKIAAHGFKVFVLRRPYNESFEARTTNPNITFIDSLAEANEFVAKEENGRHYPKRLAQSRAN